MAQTRVDSDLFVNGNVSALSMTIPEGNVDDAAIKANAKVSTFKLRHRHRHVFAEPSGVTAAAKDVLLASVRGANAELVAVSIALDVLMSTGGGDDKTVTVDVKKAGVSLLNAPVTIDKTKTARTLYPAVVNTPALVAGDMIYASITVGGATGTQGAGVYVEAITDEDAN